MGKKKREPELTELRAAVENYLRRADPGLQDSNNCSYETVECAIEGYSKLVNSDPNIISNDDFQFLFSLVRITSTKSEKQYDDKIELLDKCHLRESQELRTLLENGNRDHRPIGMFTIRGYLLLPTHISDDAARNFISLCVEVYEHISANETEEALRVLDNGLKRNDHKGIGEAMVSELFHCIDPQTFPILNGNMGNGRLVYDALGLKPKLKSFYPKNYVSNVRVLREYREEHFPGLSFRVLDNAQQCDDGVKECLDKLKAADALGHSYWLFRTITAKVKEKKFADLHEGETCSYQTGPQEGETEPTFSFYDISEDNEQGPINEDDVFVTLADGDQVIGYDNANSNQAMVSGLFVVKGRNPAASKITLEKQKDLQSKTTIASLAHDSLLQPLGSVDHFMNDGRVRMCKLSKAQFDEIVKECTAEPQAPAENILVTTVSDEVLHSRNVILHGAPGTGKTYLALQVAAQIIVGDYSKTGCLTDSTNSEYEQYHDHFGFVQFHPSYDYTDFVEGLRPVGTADGGVGFELKDGIFGDFLKRAAQEPDENFAFVIDEINRGDISKIFGELFFSIDPGYRGQSGGVFTQYSNMHKKNDERLYVPENVYIIGTMNDIDCSVDTFDFAMRRRFRFLELTAEKSAEEMLGKNTDAFVHLKNLNEIIKNDSDLGPSYEIGASYLLGEKDSYGKRAPLDVAEFDDLWEYQLEPLIREYLRGTRSEDSIRDTVSKMNKAFCPQDDNSTDVPSAGLSDESE